MGRARIAAMGLVVAALAGCQPRDGQDIEIAAAVRDDDGAAVQRYLDAGGDPDAVNREGQPLVYIAAGPRGGMDVLSVLVAGGADLDKPAENGRTALMNAVGWCDVSMVAALIAAGASPRYVTPDGETMGDAVCAGPLDRRAEVLNLIDAAL